MKRRCVLVRTLVFAGILCLGNRNCFAQPPQQYVGPPAMQAPSSPYMQRPVAPVGPPYGPPTINDFSWIQVEVHPPREFKVNDLITVIVDEKAEVTVNSRYDRRRQAEVQSELNELIRLGPGGVLTNAGATSPSFDITNNEIINSTGLATDSEGITYRIAATVVDILPNGNLVLEAKKNIRTNDDMWEYSITGIVRYQDVLPNNTVLSENVAELQIEKNSRGRIFSSTKRRWGGKLYDWLWPF